MTDFLKFKNGINLGTLSTDPVLAKAGDIYFNNISNEFRGYDGTQWLTILDTDDAANRTLSNLVSPTAINQDLLPDTDATRNIGSNTAIIRSIQAARFGGSDSFYSYTGDISTGSPTMNNVSNVSGLNQNMAIYGTGISPGTRILNIVGNTITMSVNASANVTGGTFTFAGFAVLRTNDGISGEPSGFAIIRSGDVINANSGEMFARSGNVTGTGNSGLAQVRSGNTNSGNSGITSVVTGNSTSGNTGNISMNSGTTSGSSTGALLLRSGQGLGTSTASGSITTVTGNTINGNSGLAGVGSGAVSGTGNSGLINIASGNTNSGITGSITIQSGNSSSGNTGDITLNSGTTSATRGSITLNGREINASSTNIINVLDPVNLQDAATKNYVDNAVVGTGANTTLSNLVSPTAINQDLLPDTNDTLSLGTTSLAYSKIAVNNLESPNNGNFVINKSGTGNISLITTSGDINLNAISGNVSLNSTRIVSVADPISPQDVSTKAYTDASGGGQVIVASGGTTILSATDPRFVLITGSTTHTIQLPSTSNLQVGQTWIFVNRSTGNISITDSASNLLITVPLNYQGQARVRSTGSQQWFPNRLPISNVGGSNINLASGLINNLANPVSAQDATTKSYVDNNFANRTLSNLSSPTAINQDLILTAMHSVKFADSDSSNSIGFAAPSIVSADVIWTLPAADGSIGDTLTTDGAGTLYWAAAGSGSGTPSHERFNFNGNFNVSGPVTGGDSYFRFPFNANITDVQLVRKTAGASGSTTADVLVKPLAGSWASILTTQGSIQAAAGNDVGVGVGDSIANTTAPVLSSTPVSVTAGSLLRVDLTAVESGSPDTFSVIVFFEKV